MSFYRRFAFVVWIAASCSMFAACGGGGGGGSTLPSTGGGAQATPTPTSTPPASQSASATSGIVYLPIKPRFKQFLDERPKQVHRSFTHQRVFEVRHAPYTGSIRKQPQLIRLDRTDE